MTVPFPHDRQPCSELTIVNGPHRTLTTSINHVPSVDSALGTGSDEGWLPGHPWVQLEDESIAQFLEDELVPHDLNQLSPHLWLVGKQDSSHISSLTHQIVRGREIVVTEKPGLHLTWIHERVFIKPLPPFILSHAFWEFYLSADSPIPDARRQDIVKAALGFLRSYAYLIQHRSDYLLATHQDRLGLVPESISYLDLVEFLRYFKEIPDGDVAPRYGFGELRLTRLNFWVKLFLRRRTYFKEYGQYGAYFAQFYGPILFIFGVVAIALNSMQVVLAVQSVGESDKSWLDFARVSRWFSVFTLFVVLFLSALLVAKFLHLVVRESLYAIRDLYRKRTRSRDSGSKSGDDLGTSGRHISSSA